ncbi:hypothetical protein DM15PD_10310 [Aristophania vespae]|nr:hypothetical protein DM15PD_10310 [Aristophania vespae]
MFFWNDPRIGQDPNRVPVISMRVLIGIHIFLVLFIALIHWGATSLQDF